MHVLNTYCGLQMSHRDEVAVDSDAFSAPQFIVELDEHAFRDDINRVTQVLADLLLPVVTAARTLRLAEAARNIIAAGTEGIASGDLRVDVPIALRFGAAVKPDFVTRVWSSLHELKEMGEGWRFPVELSSQNEGDAAINCGVVVGPIGVQIPRLVTKKLRTMAKDMVSRGRGLPISELVLAVGCSNDDGFCSNDGEEESEGEKIVATGRLLDRILCASECAEEDRGEVQQLNLFWSLDSAVNVGRYSSAIAESKTTDSLILRFYPVWGDDFGDFDYPDPVDHAWECLAYTLFSRHARMRSTVTSVVLDGLEMGESHADSIAKVLASSDPARLLFGRYVRPRVIRVDRDNEVMRGGPDNGGNGINEVSDGIRVDGDNSGISGDADDDDSSSIDNDGTGRPIVIGMLKEGTPLALLPARYDKSFEWYLETDVHGVRVLQDHDESELAIVLVPEYGVCKVRRDQVIPFTAPRTSNGVTSLHMQFNKDSDDVTGLPQFLELIGSSLARLSLDLPTEASIWTPAMLKSCPNLKTFVLNGVVSVGTEAFLKVYRDSDMQIEELDCAFDDTGRLMRELADERTSFAKHMKRLSYRFDSRWRNNDDRVTLEDISSMLSTNRTLEYLHVMTPRGVPGIKRQIAQINAFHKQMLQRRLSLPCRAALISIFTSSRLAQQDREAKRLNTGVPPPQPDCLQSVLADFPIDRRVLSLIFAFAAPCVHRRVYATTYHPFDL